MIDILLAEDQGMVRQGLKMMIETDTDIRVLKEAKNGKEAVDFCETHHFDMVILDIRMPIMDGLTAAREIHRLWPDRKILMLTTFNDDDYALEALRAGASGYMLKDAEADELIRSIRSCLAGGVSLQDHVAAKVLPRLLNQAPVKEEVDPSLTPREVEIIVRVGNGRNNQEVASELCLSVGTVKNHISVILDKLALRDRTQLAIYAIRHHLV
ncbi:DNA-binding response regulator [Salipaludibacillus keqinensis]|uniref:DNA-binding response regulator n=1 Tax=Salipaludibacillus keqinensis TaxID=2045207 RepID=A0A323TMR5_9BACI|nr:response regulator transcription factor [Salipaludibacillus keqinensis]PYZ95356.1 DNA-binding response regulator [Salipaludibacillus keqinensis]